MKFSYKSLGVFLLLLIPVFFVIGQHSMLNLYGFRSLIPDNFVLIAIFDTVITISLVAIFFGLYSKSIFKIKLSWMRSYSQPNKYNILLMFNLIFLVFTLVYAPGFLELIVQGVTRQAINDQVERMPFLLTVADKYFLIASVFVLFSGAPSWVKNFTILCFLLTTVVMTSRSNLMFFLVVYILVHFIHLEGRSFRKLVVVCSSIILFAVFFGIYVQNRGSESVFLGPFKPIEDLFLYQSYSLYLASFSAEFAYEYEKIFYGFFGYSSEYLYRMLGGANFVGSDFVMDFRLFKSQIRTHSANILYPWWSWFYGVFGIAGIFIKAFYVWILLYISLLSRSLPLFVLILYWVLFTGFTKHPLLTLDAFFMLFFAMVIGFAFRIKVKRGSQ